MWGIATSITTFQIFSILIIRFLYPLMSLLSVAQTAGMWHHQQTDPETSSNSRRSRLATTREVCWTFHCSLQSVIDSCQFWWLLTHAQRCLVSPHLFPSCVVKIWREKHGETVSSFDMWLVVFFFVFSLSLFLFLHKEKKSWPAKPAFTSNQYGQGHSFGQLARSKEGDVERFPKSKFYQSLT